MRHAMVRIAATGLTCCVAALAGNSGAQACTAFCAAGAGQVLVGNNEDWDNPRTRIWFVPASPGSFGRVYVGFDDLWPQGGMNERGLWFDGFAAPAMKDDGSSDLPQFPGNIVDRAMAESSTVEEVVRLFRQYNRGFLSESILMFADASGDAVSIERNAIVRKTRGHFVQTNFHQSLAHKGEQDGRFTVASEMLERAGTNISTDLFRRILAATHQKSGYPTLYSNIYDLRARTLRLYYFHDFDHVVTFNLAEELKKGARVLNIPSLFPPNDAAEAFAARRQEETRSPGPAVAITLVAIPGIMILIAVFGWLRGGRQVRVGLSVLAGLGVTAGLLTVLAFNLHGDASAKWLQFSIGPAAGKSAWVGPNLVRANGITLKAALAIAYDVPPVRVVAPAWLAETRYSINAVVGIDASDSFRSLLQEELKNRLHLETHFEVRPFEVFVLTAEGGAQLERAQGSRSRISLDDREARLQEASMEQLASALQGIVGKPVIDETGLEGWYNLEFGWGEDRVASVTSALQPFGLRLSPGSRNMEVLIVDRVRRDAALVLLAEISRMTRSAPAHLRQRITDVLRIH